MRTIYYPLYFVRPELERIIGREEIARRHPDEICTTPFGRHAYKLMEDGTILDMWSTKVFSLLTIHEVQKIYEEAMKARNNSIANGEPL